MEGSQRWIPNQQPYNFKAPMCFRSRVRIPPRCRSRQDRQSCTSPLGHPGRRFRAAWISGLPRALSRSPRSPSIPIYHPKKTKYSNIYKCSTDLKWHVVFMHWKLQNLFYLFKLFGAWRFGFHHYQVQQINTRNELFLNTTKNLCTRRDRQPGLLCTPQNFAQSSKLLEKHFGN